jgi:hypothetical protein
MSLTVARPFLAGGRRGSVVRPGGELALWEWGSGPTVVLVHGGAPADVRIFSDIFAETLAVGRTVEFLAEGRAA